MSLSAVSSCSAFTLSCQQKVTSREQKKCTVHEILLCYLVCSTAGEVIGLLNDYLFSELPLDIENVHKGATTLCHLKRTLGTACQGLNR